MKEFIQTSIDTLDKQISILNEAREQTDNKNSIYLLSVAITNIRTAKFYLKEAKDLGYTEFILESPKGCEDNTSGETPTDEKAIKFPLLTVEQIQEKIVKSLNNTERVSAIKLIDSAILPTLGSEADIKFWEGISDMLKQKEKS
jgi:hypothetical protein